MSFPGMIPGQGTAGLDPEKLKEQQMIKMMHMAMESCVGKSIMSGVMGFGLGGVFGLFMSSMRYDTSMTTQSIEISKLPMKEQLRQGFKDMGKASWSSARNFGKVGLLYSGIECGIEGYRGKNEMANPIVAGCATGAILAKGGGPQAMAVGCGGFAAFSAAIEYYMHMPSDDPSRDPIS
ncbi:putative mitochondrial import inner membrane translocase subunit [Myriangium duriaei CBS 260.36]|uniref:Mitochondrial import inner membrane translocase subunit TIM22 n=1 Tax=Myriangium duriaei CBS 260.36 TaxID=1168546 RepID=A0A9P4J1W5_9PEZI|nr:putative mitochondrial import inner membrane translocase subunit [Myriangium duriaei CBS 260.36]